jgi:hypothetical protein
MDQTVRIELSVNQLNIVLAALAKQPLEAVLDTFNAVRSQAESQMKEHAPLASKVTKQ